MSPTGLSPLFVERSAYSNVAGHWSNGAAALFTSPSSLSSRVMLIFLVFFDVALDAEKVQIGIFMKEFIDERRCIGQGT